MVLPSDRGALSAFSAGTELLELLEKHCSPKESLPKLVSVAARLVTEAAAFSNGPAKPVSVKGTAKVSAGGSGEAIIPSMRWPCRHQHTDEGAGSHGLLQLDVMPILHDAMQCLMQPPPPCHLKQPPHATNHLMQHMHRHRIMQQPRVATSIIPCDHRAGGSGVKAEGAALDLSAARVTVPDLAFSTPWGKFTLLLMDDCVALTNGKATIKVPLTAVKHVAVCAHMPTMCMCMHACMCACVCACMGCMLYACL